MLIVRSDRGESHARVEQRTYHQLFECVIDQSLVAHTDAVRQPPKLTHLPPPGSALHQRVKENPRPLPRIGTQNLARESE